MAKRLRTIAEMVCRRCKHRWFPRQSDPDRCPKCKLDPTTERIRRPGGGRKPSAAA